MIYRPKFHSETYSVDNQKEAVNCDLSWVIKVNGNVEVSIFHRITNHENNTFNIDSSCIELEDEKIIKRFFQLVEIGDWNKIIILLAQSPGASDSLLKLANSINRIKNYPFIIKAVRGNTLNETIIDYEGNETITVRIQNKKSNLENNKDKTSSELIIKLSADNSKRFRALMYNLDFKNIDIILSFLIIQTERQEDLELIDSIRRDINYLEA